VRFLHVFAGGFRAKIARREAPQGPGDPRFFSPKRAVPQGRCDCPVQPPGPENRRFFAGKRAILQNHRDGATQPRQKPRDRTGRQQCGGGGQAKGGGRHGGALRRIGQPASVGRRDPD
jgi:hypothetical protein